MWFFILLGVVVVVALVYSPGPLNKQRPEPHEEADSWRNTNDGGGI